MLINSILIPLVPTKKEYGALGLPTELEDYQSLGISDAPIFGTGTEVITKPNDLFLNETVLNAVAVEYRIEVDQAKKLMKFVRVLQGIYVDFLPKQKKNESDEQYRNRRREKILNKREFEKGILSFMKTEIESMTEREVSKFFIKEFDNVEGYRDQLKQIYIEELEKFKSIEMK